MNGFVAGLRHFHRAIWSAFRHDQLMVAKGAAYSSMMTLFPALLALAGGLARQHELARYTQEISYALGLILPPGSAQLAQRYFDAKNHRSTHIVYSAGSIAVFAATGVIISWMQGFRRAYQIHKNPWNLVKERIIAFVLVPSALFPMFGATLLVAFGGQIYAWIMIRTERDLQPVIGGVWTSIEWLIALVTSVLVLALVYHFGNPKSP
ncbi:MAG: YihY/virulence factor BrkB family protein, partial [Acidobacteriales bacterium]|nr:YihY/virulence factor BrkB family protein [Terriglobales bacterium]